MKYIRSFTDISFSDIDRVGGKNAALGQMIQDLKQEGIRIPNGFAIMADAYWEYVNANNLKSTIASFINELSVPIDLIQLAKVGNAIRTLFIDGQMPLVIEKEIDRAYQDLSDEYGCTNLAVAVRSSATAEDLPDASFAGQQETFLNVQGKQALIVACKKSFSSLFTDRAIVYRHEKGFDHMQVALSIGVQKMVNAKSSGVAFSLDTESGFKDVIMINASWGLGESIVKGLVIPDEFVVFTPKLEKGLVPIINKKLGSKKIAFESTDSVVSPVRRVAVPQQRQHMFCLSDKEIVELAHSVITIEQCYTKKNNQWTPVDVEWAQDSNDGHIYIVQARPETIHSLKKSTHEYTTYTLVTADKPLSILAQGVSIGSHIVAGHARVIRSVNDIDQVQEGDIIVTIMSDPDWVPALKRAKGIITQEGGRTCHAAIVSRELGIPALVGIGDAMDKIIDGQAITLDCSQGASGYVYKGIYEYERTTIPLTCVPKLPISLLVNIADPDRALALSQLPVDGVGLARIEFIISNRIGIHPMALLHPEKITDVSIKKHIDQVAAPYTSYTDFFIDTLSFGIGTIAAAFYPRPVVVRFSDFKTNEYRHLVGGGYFEFSEANPTLGFRGASRYCDQRYKEAFALECRAIKKVRQQMGLDNIAVMIPFVRTIGQASSVLDLLKTNGLARGDGFKVWMMAEIPANILLIDQFSEYFDGFSIGSNDLTQLTLGIDRDAAVLQDLFDEQDPAMLKQYELLIKGAKRSDKTSSICGQAPSDFHDLALFLIECGIDSISLNPDAVIPFLLQFQT